MPKCWNILTDSFWVVHQNLPKFQKLNFDENISEKLITYELWVQQHQFLEIFNKMSKRECSVVLIGIPCLLPLTVQACPRGANPGQMIPDDKILLRWRQEEGKNKNKRK